MTSDIIETSTTAPTTTQDLTLAPPLSTLGHRIRAVRVRAGISQNDFAAAVGFTRQSLIRWERDDASPPIVILPILHQRFGVDPNWVVMGESQSFRSHPVTIDWERFDRIAAQVNDACRQFGISTVAGSTTATDLTRSLFEEDPAGDEANLRRARTLLRMLQDTKAA